MVEEQISLRILSLGLENVNKKFRGLTGAPFVIWTGDGLKPKKIIPLNTN
jgi:hypothetical protein